MFVVVVFEKSPRRDPRTKRKARTAFENEPFELLLRRSTVVDLGRVKFKRPLQRPNHLIWESSNRRSN